jgi:hypothetical protein
MFDGHIVLNLALTTFVLFLVAHEVHAITGQLVPAVVNAVVVPVVKKSADQTRITANGKC